MLDILIRVSVRPITMHDEPTNTDNTLVLDLIKIINLNFGTSDDPFNLKMTDFELF